MQQTRDALAMVRTRVLLFLAEKLGPAVDRIDVASPELATRDLVVAMVERQVGSPAEVRASLIDLIEMEYVFAGRNGDIDSVHGCVGLTPHGLVAARLVQPDVSKLRLLRLVLPGSRNAPEFAAKFDTGRPVIDRKLNASGLTLVCFYLLAIEQPSLQHPATLDWFAERVPCFAIGGLGPKSGRGLRLEAGKESVSEALHLLAEALRNILPLKVQEDDRDGRRNFWFLDAVFPEVRMVVPRKRAEFRDWRVFFLRMDSYYWEKRRGLQEAETKRLAAEAKRPAEAKRNRGEAGAGATGAGS